MQITRPSSRAACFAAPPLMASVGRERKKDEEEDNMSSIKERMAEVIQEQPEDTTYEEIMRELAFQRMIARGLEDSHAGRVIPNDEIGRRIRTWQK
jgi:predicted transcriptional regulator